MMRKFATQSCHFMDTYEWELNGKQATWVVWKDRGHQLLQKNILEELGKEGLACLRHLCRLFFLIKQNKECTFFDILRESSQDQVF